MTTIMLLSLLVALSVALATCRSPITLIIWIWLIALFTSLTLAALMSAWFGFIVFLIYISGMLVMFTYFSAIAPNQQLSLSHPIIMTTLPLFLLASTQLILIGPPPLLMSMQLMPQTFLMMSPPALLLLAFILFLALIIVTKITRLSQGPLRPFQ